MKDETYRILVADDDPPILELLGEYLSTRGHQVKLVPNGELARAALEEDAFDVLVTDMKMPGEDGLSLLKHVREQNLPVATIMMTGYGTIESAISAMKSGAHNYLLKPFRLREVHASVSQAVEARRQEEATMSLKHLRGLQKEIESIHHPKELEALYQSLCEKSADELEADGAMLAFFEPAEGRWVPYASAGNPQAFRQLDLDAAAQEAGRDAQPLLSKSCWFGPPKHLLVAPIRGAIEPGPPLTLGVLLASGTQSTAPSPQRALQVYGSLVGQCVANQVLLSSKDKKGSLAIAHKGDWIRRLEEESLRCGQNLQLEAPQAKAASWALRLRAGEDFSLRELVEGAPVDVVTVGGGGLPISTLEALHPILKSLEERVDGQGSPNGALDVPREARLAAALAHWIWLTQTRRYAPLLNVQEACEALEERALTHYGEEAVNAVVEALGHSE